MHHFDAEARGCNLYLEKSAACFARNVKVPLVGVNPEQLRTQKDLKNLCTALKLFPSSPTLARSTL
jgi:hypothetical protein